MEYQAGAFVIQRHLGRLVFIDLVEQQRAPATARSGDQQGMLQTLTVSELVNMNASVDLVVGTATEASVIRDM